MSDGTTETTSSTDSPKHREGRLTWYALFLAVVVGTVLRSCGRWHWLCELTTHFTVQSSVLALIAAAMLWKCRWRVMAAICLGLTLLNATEWLRCWVPRAPTEAVKLFGQPLVVVSTNVYSRNRNAQALHDWLMKIRPDVVFVSEVDPWWASQLEHWKTDWPYQILRPRGDNFGLALLSKHPILDSEVRKLELDIPAVRARIGDWTIVGIHTLPPGGANTGVRNRQLVESARWISDMAKPRVVVGDLNCAPGSPYFDDFVEACRLSDSRSGFGWQASWPTSNPLFWIPIDHCLVERDADVQTRAVGPDIGSDHYPIWAKIGPAQ